jgi:Tfp pilus assembly protein FimT
MGFTIVELIMSLALLALLYAVAVPSIGRSRVRNSVYNSRQIVIASLSLARATAVRYGRSAVLRVDEDSDRVWVEADTSVGGSGVLDTLGYFDLEHEYDVDLRSNRSAFCFNGRGVGTTGPACPQAGGEMVVVLRGRADSIIVSPLGRVIP